MGDYFKIIGPPGDPGNNWRRGNRAWRPGRHGGRWRPAGWQPRLYTSYPGDTGSRSVRPRGHHAFYVAALSRPGENFKAFEIRRSTRYVSARIEVWGRLPTGNTELRQVWLNVAKRIREGPREYWVDWVQRVGAPSDPEWTQ